MFSSSPNLEACSDTSAAARARGSTECINPSQLSFVCKLKFRSQSSPTRCAALLEDGDYEVAAPGPPRTPCTPGQRDNYYVSIHTINIVHCC